MRARFAFTLAAPCPRQPSGRSGRFGHQCDQTAFTATRHAPHQLDSACMHRVRHRALTTQQHNE
eukprot:10861185-Alexandrium_andersonii.AAC.1